MDFPKLTECLRNASLFLAMIGLATLGLLTLFVTLTPWVMVPVIIGLTAYLYKTDKDVNISVNL